MHPVLGRRDDAGLVRAEEVDGCVGSGDGGRGVLQRRTAWGRRRGGVADGIPAADPDRRAGEGGTGRGAEEASAAQPGRVARVLGGRLRVRGRGHGCSTTPGTSATCSENASRATDSVLTWSGVSAV